MIAVAWLALYAGVSRAAVPDDIAIVEYAAGGAIFSGCTQIAFRDGREVVTAGARLYFREEPSAAFRASPLDGLNDAHSVAYNPRDQ